MFTAGIIAEFNPFHDGHRELIRRVKEEVRPDCLVIVMSMWYSSRGLPCLLSLEDKTRLALEAGADLVIGLPAIYVLQSADYFARYAIEALKCAGVDLLCFGSESADLPLLKQALRDLESLNCDVSTSQARNAARAGLAMRPNDILALQYIRWAQAYGMEVLPFERNQSLKSATAIRADYFSQIPQPGDDLYHSRQNWNSYYPYLRLQLLESDKETLESFFLVEEGIENRLVSSALQHADFDGFLNSAISKTYSKARIQRTCMMILMQINKKEMKDHAFFFDVIVLGMNQTGQKRLGSLPVGAPVCARFRNLSPWLQQNLIKEQRLYSLIDNSPASWQIVRIVNPEGSQNQSLPLSGKSRPYKEEWRCKIETRTLTETTVSEEEIKEGES